jgi:hypothetical protein
MTALEPGWAPPLVLGRVLRAMDGMRQKYEVGLMMFLVF